MTNLRHAAGSPHPVATPYVAVHSASQNAERVPDLLWSGRIS